MLKQMMSKFKSSGEFLFAAINAALHNIALINSTYVLCNKLVKTCTTAHSAQHRQFIETRYNASLTTAGQTAIQVTLSPYLLLQINM